MATKRMNEKMFVTTISVPDALYQTLKRIALDQRRPVIELIRQALAEFADRHSRRPLNEAAKARLRERLDKKRSMQ